MVECVAFVEIRDKEFLRSVGQGRVERSRIVF